MAFLATRRAVSEGARKILISGRVWPREVLEYTFEKSALLAPDAFVGGDILRGWPLPPSTKSKSSHDKNGAPVFPSLSSDKKVCTEGVSYLLFVNDENEKETEAQVAIWEGELDILLPFSTSPSSISKVMRE